jgi:hypothetical protein
MVSLLLTIMMMLTIPSVGNTNLFSTNTANAQEDYYDDKYGYYYYPPDYYKYECQKGPFEGDLVESVEFCFKKAHDRDDKQGDGEEGGPGPTGLFQINASNYYKQTNWTYCYHRSFSWPAGCSFYGFVSYGRCRNKW